MPRIPGSTRWKSARAPLQTRSVLVSFCLHVGLAGALYGFGFGAIQWQGERRLTVTFEQPEPTPYIEEVPEPIEEEEAEETQEIELDRPIIEDPVEEPLPEPEFLIEDEPPEQRIRQEAWLSRILPRKEAPPAKKADQAKQEPSLPTVVPQPLAGSNPPPAYPSYAIRNNLEGTTLLEVQVDDEGIVGKVRLIRSSGHKILDEAAMRAVKTWRFDHGPGLARVPIVFTLHSR